MSISRASRNLPSPLSAGLFFFASLVFVAAPVPSGRAQATPAQAAGACYPGAGGSDDPGKRSGRVGRAQRGGDDQRQRAGGHYSRAEGLQCFAGHEFAARFKQWVVFAADAERRLSAGPVPQHGRRRADVHVHQHRRKRRHQDQAGLSIQAQRTMSSGTRRSPSTAMRVSCRSTTTGPSRWACLRATRITAWARGRSPTTSTIILRRTSTCSRPTSSSGSAIPAPW